MRLTLDLTTMRPRLDYHGWTTMRLPRWVSLMRLHLTTEMGLPLLLPCDCRGLSAPMSLPRCHYPDVTTPMSLPRCHYPDGSL